MTAARPGPDPDGADPDGVVLIGDPRVTAVPLADGGEPLVDLRALGFRLAASHADPDGAFARVRAGVADRLAAARAALPAGLDLLVVEGYRPPSLQWQYFNTYRDELATLRPDWASATLDAEASRFIAPPGNAPHTFGAAVDLTLCGADGTELDLGTGVNATPLASANACYTAATNIAPVARANRDVLVTALTAAGLVNYPTEWWHWSYGDRYWAWVTASPATLYGPVDGFASVDAIDS